MACFAPEAVESRTGAHISLHPQEADGGQAPFKTKLAGCSLKDIMGIAVLALVGVAMALAAQMPTEAPPGDDSQKRS